MRNGRPDSGYLYWRWSPRSELPKFNPKKLLKFMRNKSFSLVIQSLVIMCCPYSAFSQRLQEKLVHLKRLRRNLKKGVEELTWRLRLEKSLRIDENVAREIINHRSLRQHNIIRFKEGG
ncbi:protein trichome birefringence-like 2 [Vigna unguiculata]|uniref:protein trichome birefringence-like 2 n=1 Tax=Vigna unguiculata TaxID=3917 RepID=UPI001016C494|nr:protein trichome birefringence-like 2 [Vigna unguiculata]